MRVLVELDGGLTDPPQYLRDAVAAAGAQAAAVTPSIPGDSRFFSIALRASSGGVVPSDLLSRVVAALRRAPGVRSAVPEPDAE